MAGKKGHGGTQGFQPPKLYGDIAELMYEWMPTTADTFQSLIETAMDEEQDLLIVLFGVPGKGKSNLGYLLSLFATQIVNKHLGLKRYFSLRKQAAWLGADFIQLFRNPAKELAKLLESRDKEKLEGLIKKNKGVVWWLDEAKDLNALEMMTTFNKTFSGILATCRALQYIYILCIDTPTKFISDIREFRVNMGVYVFIGKKLHKFEDGKTRNMRMGGLYGRKEWSRMIFDENKKIRSSLLMPTLFFNRYKSYTLEPIPLFPRGKDFDKYTLLKYGSMGRIITTDLEKWDKKRGETGTLKGIYLKCPKCDNVWEYMGKKRESFAVTSCSKCRNKYTLKRFVYTLIGWEWDFKKEKELGKKRDAAGVFTSNVP